jgi:1-phosphatidylinositol phosphodiesterase
MEEWLCEGHHLEAPNTTSRHPDVTDEGEEKGTKRAKSGDGSTGVVVMDHVGEHGDWELVKLIVGMNMGVLAKMKTLGKS